MRHHNLYMLGGKIGDVGKGTSARTSASQLEHIQLRKENMQEAAQPQPIVNISLAATLV